MADTVTANYAASLSVIYTSGNALVNPGGASITVDGLSTAGQLDANSVPATSKLAVGSQALTSGSGSIDLTNLTGPFSDEVVDFTGLKVQIAMFTNPATNANDIVLTFGASTPYLLLGAAFKITLKPGQSTGPILLVGLAPTVSGSLKLMDISGTGAQALSYEMVAG